MKNLKKKYIYKNKIILNNGATFDIYTTKKKKNHKIDINTYSLKNINIDSFKEDKIISFLKKINL